MTRIEGMDADHSRLIDAMIKLEELWQEQGISLADRVEETTVRERIAALGKRVSDDVVTLYSVAGGMLNYEMDDACFTLWPLDYAIERNREADSAHWLFGDHLIDSLLYATSYKTLHESSVVMFFALDGSQAPLSATLEQLFVKYAEANTTEERLDVII